MNSDTNGWCPFPPLPNGAFLCRAEQWSLLGNLSKVAAGRLDNCKYPWKQIEILINFCCTRSVIIERWIFNQIGEGTPVQTDFKRRSSKEGRFIIYNAIILTRGLCILASCRVFYWSKKRTTIFLIIYSRMSPGKGESSQRKNIEDGFSKNFASSFHCHLLII